MDKKTTRLYFIDAMRAWAILMMLQGHFMDGLLENVFRTSSDTGFTIWRYFRGITAPVFFTVSGFIFTFLLLRVPQKGLENPRVKKGIKRGLQLLLIGYLLRLNLFGLLVGEIYGSFFLVDVLHCIGLSILSIIGIYVLTSRKNTWVLPAVLFTITILLFTFEPYYKQFSFGFLPEAIANYFTKANGSVFTILPWLGYATFGGFLSILFKKFKDAKYLYPAAIAIAVVAGSGLIFYSSELFLSLSRATEIQLFSDIYFNNYLFIRLGDVFLVFAFFMLFRSFMKHATILKIGQSTLSIYVIHFIILYGSFTGLGLYRFFEHSLTPPVAIIGAIAFMISCSFLALQYEKHKTYIKLNIVTSLRFLLVKIEVFQSKLLKVLRLVFDRIKYLALKLFRLAKN